MEESVQYPILGPDAREQWASSTPAGFGYLRLGPEHRAFALSMFHQHHCLRLMRKAFEDNVDASVPGHFNHCLLYLRSFILCSPDLTLEPHDTLHRTFEVERSGGSHVCNNWEQVYSAMELNWDNWVEARERLTSHAAT